MPRPKAARGRTHSSKDRQITVSVTAVGTANRPGAVPVRLAQKWNHGMSQGAPDLSAHSPGHLLAVENELNNRPRRVLGDRTQQSSSLPC
jgi:hypothetical protein